MKKYHYYIVTYTKLIKKRNYALGFTIETEREYYVHYLTKEEAEKKLAKCKVIDENAHIFEADRDEECRIGRAYY
jgi:hypothetical protein